MFWAVIVGGLNAPSGAQCLPTGSWWVSEGTPSLAVSMHLLVLSAFRQGASRLYRRRRGEWSQCTFWCSVLSDTNLLNSSGKKVEVSMHLLVLSAFRPKRACSSLKARIVSMHLLVLSAFRLRPQKTAPQRRLPERNRRRPGKHHIESARTCPIKPHNREKPPQNDPAPPAAPTSQYATDFQRTQAKKPTPHNYAAVNTATKATDNCPCADTTDRFPLTAALRPSAVFMSTVSRPWRSHGGPGRT